MALQLTTLVALARDQSSILSTTQKQKEKLVFGARVSIYRALAKTFVHQRSWDPIASHLKEPVASWFQNEGALENLPLFAPR